MVRTADEPLRKRVRRFFDPGVRKRGDIYRKTGRVRRLRWADDGHITAKVDGSRGYDVSIGATGGEAGLEIACTCPHFADRGQPCKHAWAALGAAEDAGYAEALLGRDGPPGNGDNGHGTAQPGQGRARTGGGSGRQSEWERALTALARPSEAAGPRTLAGLASGETVGGYRLAYHLDPVATKEKGELAVEIGVSRAMPDGQWQTLLGGTLGSTILEGLEDPLDRQIAGLLLRDLEAVEGLPPEPDEAPLLPEAEASDEASLPVTVQPTLVPMMGRTGRCYWHPDAGLPQEPLAFDEAVPWQLRLEVTERGKQGYRLVGALWRDGERRPLAEPVLLTEGGFVFWRDRIAPLELGGAFDWVAMLRDREAIDVPAGQIGRMLQLLLPMGARPPVDLPASLSVESSTAEPQPRLILVRPPSGSGRTVRLEARLAFGYEGRELDATSPETGVVDPDTLRFVARDREAERRAVDRLCELGFEWLRDLKDDAPRLFLDRKLLPETIRTLTAEGWLVEAEGEVYRGTAGSVSASVESGIDWFELHGSADFGEASVALPELLEAVAKGERTVRLDDGSLGMLPEAWLERYAPLAQFSQRGSDADSVAFGGKQTALLDALLEELPEVEVDRQFERARRALPRFTGIGPKDPPAEFEGALRPYQREGLGWLHFLRRFGFGGVLADDMGLGKTVQVLALLAARRKHSRRRDADGRPGPPSLVVAPRSLLQNWLREAERFAPRLRVLRHLGPQRWRDAQGERLADAEPLRHYDVILTTYATMRLDIELLKDLELDYAILDEAQAIKNGESASAKAARLLRAGHRLALTGTPVENHVGELFSLFDFLNPGMLGRAGVSQRLRGQGTNPDQAALEALNRAVRPFILRRTKEQVAPELPERTEQTIHCGLEGRQRRQYDELVAHYRDALLERVERDGINSSQMHVLEALLRLRQAACHPGLIDKRYERSSSAKLDALLPQLRELVAEGHKALVFSQFTSFLGIVRESLEKEGIDHAYLDGQTRKRSEKVDRFQNEPDCSVFLISLKAGGLGLNLTAASYVFLLDPWWNPAVEAQAIDRTHRIGQSARVCAYRLIARETVEEKVLELQASKRALADAIISGDSGPLSELTRDDLRYLLS